MSSQLPSAQPHDDRLIEPPAHACMVWIPGGPHWGSPNCCRQYRPAARHAQPIDPDMSHVGFRCVIRP